MCMLMNLTPFAEKKPPQGVDLFVCGDPDEMSSRCYGIMQFFEKGTILPAIVHSDAPSREERILDALICAKFCCRKAPETGYYFLEACEEDESGDAIWLESCINPLDSVYAVINPEDME